MPWKQIRECGYLYTNSDLEDGRGIRKTKHLLQEIVILFAKEVKKFYTVLEEFPFNYNERQIHSILFPAIQKTGSVVFLEQPIKRKYRGQSPKYGWIDYWVYKENTTYLIEVKHSMYSLRSRNLETTKTRWKEGIKQINSIPDSEVKELGLDNSEIFLITMMILPFWKGSSDKEKLVPSEKEDVLAVFSNEIMAKLNPKPNWGAIWYLHDELQEPEYLTNNWYELYPAVSMQCLIKKFK